MGFLSKFSRTPPSTATDFAADEKALPAPGFNKEGAHGEEFESSTETHQRHVEPGIERRVVRKMDMRIVPLVTALYVLAFLDRSNIGNARLAGMTKDLKLVGSDYQWLLTIFYITYIIFEFQTLMWKIVPPHVRLFRVIIPLFVTCWESRAMFQEYFRCGILLDHVSALPTHIQLVMLTAKQ